MYRASQMGDDLRQPRRHLQALGDNVVDLHTAECDCSTAQPAPFPVRCEDGIALGRREHIRPTLRSLILPRATVASPRLRLFDTLGRDCDQPRPR
jgi:hypothetical protein